MHVEVLDTEDIPKAIPRLAEILIEGMSEGAELGFKHALSQQQAEEFWLSQILNVKAGNTFILVSKLKLDDIVGAVMLHRSPTVSHQHRGVVEKLIVSNEFRRQGAGAALVQHIEKLAPQLGMTMINFDAIVDSPSDKHYRALGYQAGEVLPHHTYSLKKGRFEDVVIFSKSF